MACAVALAGSFGCSLLSSKTAASTSRSFRMQDGYFFGHDVRQEESVIYVLDLSGSMNERTGSRVEQASKKAAAQASGALVSSLAGRGVGSATKQTLLDMDKKVELVKDHLLASIRGLPDGAQFNVILFSGKVEKLSPVMISAGGASTAAVSAFVSQLKSGGATSLKTALSAGLQEPTEELIVLTDGLPTDSSPDEILAMVSEANQEHARRISTVGVGADQAKPFLTRLAETNGGQYVGYE